jgi:hypothetical protein
MLLYVERLCSCCRLIFSLRRFDPLGCTRSVSVYLAQIFNLPYRRFVIGKAPVTPRSLDFADDPQVTNLRYSRLQVCATSVGNTLNNTAFERVLAIGRTLRVAGTGTRVKERLFGVINQSLTGY